MKLKEIIKKLDKSKDNESFVDLQDLGSREFELNTWLFNYSENLELKAYYFLKWYCTDSYVGGRAYFLNDELVAISYQSGRKSNETFYWKSSFAKNKVKKYLLTLMEEDTKDEVINLFDLEVEYDHGFHVEFAQQLLTKDVLIKETLERVKVIEKFDDIEKWRLVKIKNVDGVEKVVEMKDILVPYNIK